VVGGVSGSPASIWPPTRWVGVQVTIPGSPASIWSTHYMHCVQSHPTNPRCFCCFLPTNPHYSRCFLPKNRTLMTGLSVVMDPKS
jgi:hypothetical protein